MVKGYRGMSDKEVKERLDNEKSATASGVFDIRNAIELIEYVWAQDYQSAYDQSIMSNAPQCRYCGGLPGYHKSGCTRSKMDSLRAMLKSMKK